MYFFRYTVSVFKCTSKYIGISMQSYKIPTSLAWEPSQVWNIFNAEKSFKAYKWAIRQRPICSEMYLNVKMSHLPCRCSFFFCRCRIFLLTQSNTERRLQKILILPWLRIKIKKTEQKNINTQTVVYVHVYTGIVTVRWTTTLQPIYHNNVTNVSLLGIFQVPLDSSRVSLCWGVYLVL